jgi:hypothetical protein
VHGPSFCAKFLVSAASAAVNDQRARDFRVKFADRSGMAALNNLPFTPDRP